MNHMNNKNVIQGVLIIAGLCVLVALLNWGKQKRNTTLTDYATNNPEIAYQTHDKSENEVDTKTENEAVDENNTEATNIEEDPLQIKKEAVDQTDGQPVETQEEDTSLSSSAEDPEATKETNLPSLIGKTLNQTESSSRQSLEENEDFYIEPISDNLSRYITGVSYPAKTEGLSISLDELRYLHLLHYNFDNEVVEGELICNQAIAEDLLDIFHTLYSNQYQLEKILLIDEYGGDDHQSMLDNNTSCFNYREVEGTTSLSKHALGLAIDINPFYNPYITYNKDGTENISPEGSDPYADRTASFPYKIDEQDLCYKLFIEHGFTWGGNWNSCKDYQHFQKTK